MTPDKEPTEAELDKIFDGFAAAKAPPAASSPPDPTVEPPQNQAAPAAPAPAVAETPDEAAQAPSSPAAPTQSDIWANATPEQKAAFADLEHRFKAHEGRVPAMQRSVAELTQEISRLRAAPPQSAPAREAAPPPPASNKDKPKSLRDDPRYKQLSDDYPDLMNPLLDAIDGLKGEIDQTRGAVTGLAHETTQTRIDKNEARLSSAVPDWKTLTAQPQFFEWLGGRPKAIQEMAARNGEFIADADEAIDLVSQYKQHTFVATRFQPQQPAAPVAAPITDRRSQQLAANRAAPSRSPSPAANGPASDDPDALFNHFAAKRAAQGR
jgi:hypothetical protein